MSDAYFEGGFKSLISKISIWTKLVILISYTKVLVKELSRESSLAICLF